MAEKTTMRLRFSGKTDIGKARKHNEDSFIIGSDLKKNRWEFDDSIMIPSEFGSLLVLADGAGGVNAGGEAISEPAVNAIAEKFRNLQRLPASDAEARQMLQSVMLEAHQIIIQKIQQNSVYKNPSTTMIVAWLLDSKAHIAWSGDSRAYLLRNQNCELLTDDHSMVWQLVRQSRLTQEQARVHTDSHILTQCLGSVQFPPQPDALTVRLKQKDRLLLCSDGVHSMMKHDDLVRILRYYDTPSECCKGLVDGANYAGGHDNITAIVTDLPDSDMQAVIEKAQKSSIKNDIVKVKAPDDEVKFENPKDAIIAGVLIIGFLIIFLLGFIFGNQITGVAELPDEEEFETRTLAQVRTENTQNQFNDTEELPLLPEGTTNQMPTRDVRETENQENQELDSDTPPETANSDSTAQPLTMGEVAELKVKLKGVLDKKDLSLKRINTLKTKVATADEKALLKTIETDFGKLYPRLKTITDTNSQLNEPANQNEAQKISQVLQETANILKQIDQNLQKLE